VQRHPGLGVPAPAPGEDRRCYAFFHPALPNEPVIFRPGGAGARAGGRGRPLLDPDAPVGDPAVADTAIFYSITTP